MSKKHGGKRIGAGRPKGLPVKTISFYIPKFVNPVHEVELKGIIRPVIQEFSEGKEREQ